MIKNRELLIEKLNVLLDERNYLSETLKKNYKKILQILKNKKIQNVENDVIDRIYLIKLIIDLRIDDLEEVKSIYEFFGFPFDYKVPLSDLYDETLMQFVKNNLYDGQLIDDISYYDSDFKIENNQEKYEWLLKQIIDLDRGNKPYGDCYDNFLYDLYYKVNWHFDMKGNAYDLIYLELDEDYQKLREYIGEFEKDNSTYPILIEEFINTILIVFFENYYNNTFSQKKKKILFRASIESIPRDITKLAFMGKLYMNEMFSYDIFED